MTESRGHMPRISIIVPVYNVELYLSRCIDSILAQKLNDFELLLVDDGSTDKCPEICERYSQNDDRIKVIHKKNGGLSSARNAGLDIAKGEYVAFVDSDDWISADMYAEMYRFCKKENLDMAICGVKKCFEDEREDKIYYKGQNKMLMTRHEALEQLFVKSSFGEEAWNKLYRKEVFEGIRYPEGRIHEDTFCISSIMEKCSRIGYLPETYYFYYQRADSIMNSRGKIPSTDKIESIDLVLQYLKNNYPEIYDSAFYNLISAPLKNIESLLKNQSTESIAYKSRMKCFYKKYLMDIIKANGICFGTKIIMIALAFSDQLARFVLCLKRN